jgi:hypothetical protein
MGLFVDVDNSTESIVQQVMSAAGTVSNLYVRVDTAPDSTPDATADSWTSTSGSTQAAVPRHGGLLHDLRGGDELFRHVQLGQLQRRDRPIRVDETNSATGTDLVTAKFAPARSTNPRRPPQSLTTEPRSIPLVPLPPGKAVPCPCRNTGARVETPA